ncbi:MAG: DUF4396 domain-containing protein [Phycisphaeraceae bacterium]|nr:DUF4396 domain-containing protein [Phycisphaeraceae bacterium]
MLDGVMLLWFGLTGISVLFVAIDVWRTPEATALRWGFIILTIFAGPLAAFFYVLGCREPLPGTHEAYVAPIWKQVLGSTMHCASGDGLGIITGAAIASILTLTFSLDFTLEYVLGFGFGWLFFQAFAMKDMAGGDYLKSLRMTFIPEFLSMNLLMAGMTIVSKFWMANVDGSTDPANASFWFIMSMSLIAGFLCAYPMNWWLVTRHLKHGMMTVRKGSPDPHAGHDMASMNPDDQHSEHGGMSMSPGDGKHVSHDTKHDQHHDMNLTPPFGTILAVGALSVTILAGAVVIVATTLPVAD